MTTSYGRRQFLRVAATATATLSSRLLAPAIAAAPAQPAAYPYEMLVLGDSVVWGQGLTEEKKFYSVVKDRLASEILRRTDVRMLLRVHSGATILPQSEFFPRTYGEVPVVLPSLYAQAHTAMYLYEYFYPDIKPEDVGKRVSLILLNGGINDMGFPVLINPFTSEKTVAQQAEKFCHVEMHKLLEFLAAKYPNALLVVTGYYPIISVKTDKNTLLDLFLALFGLKRGNEVFEKANKTFAHSREAETAAGIDPLIKKLSDLSSRWKTESDRALGLAVDEINSQLPPSPGSSGCKRALFVKVEFAPEECYNAGPATALWRITGSAEAAASGLRLKTDDLMFEARQKQCREFPLGLLEEQVCLVAGTGHPNEKGAKKYADAIMEQLARCLTSALGSR